MAKSALMVGLFAAKNIEAYWIDLCRKTTGERRQKATIAVSA